MSVPLSPITELDRQSALNCCDYALRNVSSAAIRDVDFHAMAQCFADHGAAVIAGAMKPRAAEQAQG